MKMGVRCISRDHFSNLVCAFAKPMNGLFDPKITEVLGFREALSWLKQKGCDRIVVEMEAQLVVYGIKKSSLDNSVFYLILDDFQHLISQFDNLYLCFVSRSANSVTHTLAHETGSLSEAMKWDSILSFLANVLSSNH